MTKNKQPQKYFTSDFHFNHYSEWTGKHGETLHRGIIDFERTNFQTIQEHDEYIKSLVREWAENWAPGSTLYYLGDFGDIDYLYVFDWLREKDIKVVFVAGNHDHKDDYDLIAEHVDEFSPYPLFLSNKLIVSHEPVAVWPAVVNVHGHLHGSKLASPNYLNASIHVADYKPISMAQVHSAYSKLPKYTMRFLYEPFAEDMIFTQSKDDVIMDLDGKIDLSASRLLMKLRTEERIKNDEPYRPYCGGLKK